MVRGLKCKLLMKPSALSCLNPTAVAQRVIHERARNVSTA